MIDTEKYQKILDNGLLLDHYNILCTIRDGAKLPNSKRVTGFTNLLHKKGYIEDGILTNKAIEIVGDVVTTTTMIEVAVSTNKPKFDFAKWVISLHKKCEAKLVEAVGRRQVRDTINGKGYSFLPNPTDLGKTLVRVINSYKLSDYDKIEATILNYIDRCTKSKQWFPILMYYIMKNNTSTLVTDMESLDDNDSKSDDTIVNI